jgi:hypothetical protein
MRKPSLPRPPAGLGTPERKFWHEIVNGWALDEAALEILATACRAKQREREAREQIVTDGAAATGGAAEQSAARPGPPRVPRPQRGMALAARTRRDAPGRHHGPG